MSKQNFPPSIPGLYSYLIAVIAWLTTHAVRLGISTDTIEALVALFGDINAPAEGTYLYYKAQWDASQGGRKDTKITTNLATKSEELKVMLMDIYSNIPAGKWTDDDRVTLHRKTGLAHKPTKPDHPIKETCTVKVDARPNAVFKFSIKVDKDTKRASIPDGANAVEIAYAVVESKYRKIETDTTGKVKKQCLGPKDGTVSKIFTKANFTLEIEVELIGFDLCYFIRYINTHYPELAGEWTEPGSILIS